MAAGAPDAVHAAFAAIEAALRECGIRHAFIGALARAAWAEPRATTDVDVQVGVDAPQWSALLERLDRDGFRPVKVTPPVESGDPVPDQAFFRAPDGVRVDLLVAKTPFEDAAIARAVGAQVLGRSVPVVTREDLIVYKTIAGRPRDVADVVAVIDAGRMSGAEIDWVYVERWCAAWGVSERLAQLRSAATP